MTWFLDKAFLADLDLRAYEPKKIAEATGVSVTQASAFVDATRRYFVKSSPEYGWLAGADSARRPTLAFIGSPRIDAANTHSINVISFQPGTLELDARPVPFDGDLDDWDDILDALETSVGFLHVGDAPVRAFKFPGIWHYALVPFPFHLHDTVTGKSEEDRDVAREWIESESFVLHCGNAYFMGKDGSVESS